MVETAYVRKRTKRVIDEAHQLSRARRVRADSALRDGERVLRKVVVPVVKTMANVLTGEGYPFQVETPAGAVRLQAHATPESFVELDLDAEQDPLTLRVRVSHARGRRVLVDEEVVCSADGFASLTEDDVLTLLLAKLPPFVER